MLLTLVIPTLDERENLAVLVPELLARIPELVELIVVDDGSRDGTRELVRELAAQDTRLRLLERAPPASLTASLRDGIAAAVGDAVGWMDADQVIGVDDFARLVAAVRRGADLAIASRFSAGGAIKALAPLRRDSSAESALSWALNTLILPRLLGTGVHDYTSGIVVARRAALEGLVLEGRHGEYMIGLWLQAERAGLRVAELGYRARARVAGRSKTAASAWRLIGHGSRYLRAALAARHARRRV
jgi:dolichol-phosphate mannosyltransferase